jgi:dipeptidyl aminopeptidase/acylaminoacyl peptidase
MKKIFSLFSLFVLIGFPAHVFSQKQNLDFSTSDEWPRIEYPVLSNNGKYAQYFITVLTQGQGAGLFLEATDISWKKELPGVLNGSFTSDDRLFIFPKHGDSLGILTLGTDQVRYIARVSDFSLPKGGDGRFMVCKKGDSAQSIILVDFVTGKEKFFAATKNFKFDNTGQFLLLDQVVLKDNTPEEEVLLLDLTRDSITPLCHSCQPSQLTFDEGGSGIGFFTREEDESKSVLSLRYYKRGMDSAIVLCGPETKGMNGMILGDDMLQFAKGGQRLFFKINEPRLVTEKLNERQNHDANVLILGDHDEEIKKQELSAGPYTATINLHSIEKGVTRLQVEADKGRDIVVDDSGEWAVTESNIVGNPRKIQNIAARPDIYLISTRDGSRRVIKKRLVWDYWRFSPSGKYLIWFDRQQGNWFSYNITLNKMRNFSGSVNRPVYMEDDHPDLAASPDMVGWIENDNAVLIYDRSRDIWNVDLDGLRPPVNITHGYGAKNHIKFQYNSFLDQIPVISSSDTLLLSAYNISTKQDGFFRLIMRTGSLERLIMSSHLYTHRGENFKAKNANIYMVRRMSAEEYPNWYATSDFHDFKQLTDLAPQKKYNWYATELINWRLPNGKTGSGVLFKPENFNRASKYPIIFYYYEKNNVDLNGFIYPELSVGALPIPWFVSNGYLVFVPNIEYEIGHAGRSACSTVTSAAEYLAKKPWVDAHKMGLQGHSYGGYETDYIVGHSNLFVAAAPASAVCDNVADYLKDEGAQDYYERYQGRIGKTLWQRPDLYIENSPVFKADKVTASILIEVGGKDNHVPFKQSYEWYYALRRLQKKVWLLSYQDEYHIIEQSNDRLDYSVRLAQFFGHFLKGDPEPKWMSKGVLPGDNSLE